MLEDWIRGYEIAMEKNDKGTMQMIEKELQSVGMDRMTLLTAIRERWRERWKKDAAESAAKG